VKWREIMFACSVWNVTRCPSLKVCFCHNVAQQILSSTIRSGARLILLCRDAQEEQVVGVFNDDENRSSRFWNVIWFSVGMKLTREACTISLIVIVLEICEMEIDFELSSDQLGNPKPILIPSILWKDSRRQCYCMYVRVTKRLHTSHFFGRGAWQN